MAELEARLTSHDFWFAAVKDYGQMARDPQVVAAGHITTIPSAASGQPIRLTNHPIKYDGERPGVRLAPQPLGAQSEEILHELGYSPQQTRALVESKTVGIGPSLNDAAE